MKAGIEYLVRFVGSVKLLDEGEGGASTTLSLYHPDSSRQSGDIYPAFWPHTHFSNLNATAAPKECLTVSTGSDTRSCGGGKKRKKKPHHTHNTVFLNPCFYTKYSMNGR